MIPIGEVNQLPYENFIKLFGDVVEHCSVCAAAIWQNMPFRDVQHIHKLICEVLDEFPENAKQGVLRLQPDLPGNITDSLTSESQNEQKAAGISKMTPGEREMIKQLNALYKEKFGFPLVICARQNKTEVILQGLEMRLENDNEDEVLTGIEEVKKICLLRLLDIIES